ncbi:MAG: hypothetical protein ACOCRK_10330, partial [bacterium]
VDINEKWIKYIFWNHNYGTGFNWEVSVSGWRDEVSKELNLYYLLGDINNGDKKNYRKYKPILDYELINKQKNNKGLYVFLERLKNNNIDYSNKATKIFFQFFSIQNYNHKIKVSKILTWYKKISNIPEYRTKTPLCEKEIIIYELYKESLIYNSNDIYDIRKKLNNDYIKPVKDDLKKQYNKMLGYNNLEKPIIKGYITTNKVDYNEVSVIVNKDTTDTELWTRFKKLMRKWYIKNDVIDITYGIDPIEKAYSLIVENPEDNYTDSKEWWTQSTKKNVYGKKFERLPIEHHHFYNFLNCCILFKWDSIKDLTRCFRPINKELINLEGLVVQYRIKEYLLESIMSLLNDKRMSKDMIINYLNSDTYKNIFLKNKLLYESRSIPVFAYPGKLPTSEKWKELYDIEDKKGNTVSSDGRKGNTLSYRMEFYKWYIDYKNGLSRKEIEEKYNIDRSGKIKSRFKTHCKNLGLINLLKENH